MQLTVSQFLWHKHFRDLFDHQIYVIQLSGLKITFKIIFDKQFNEYVPGSWLAPFVNLVWLFH